MSRAEQDIAHESGRPPLRW